MQAKIIINKNYTIGKTDDRLYGSFLEHIGRAVYEGIWEPGHESADDMGFRRDVLELVKRLRVPIVRYPGGSFVSAYNWEDGTGERSKRPRRLEPAWQSIETNEIGIDEFQEWAKRAGCEVMMAVNLGTRGAEDAQNCLEYCNVGSGTPYAEMRRRNGFEKPFGIKTWCLGNEMGGLAQIGRKTPDEYGKLARETAELMKAADPSIELAVCGSSHINMPLFGEWDYKVLEYTWELVDYISVHQYYSNSSAREVYLARALDLDYYIKSIAAICDAVKAAKRSGKDVFIAFDEWNVWTDGVLANIPKGTVAPHIAEMVYTLDDALVVGSMLMTLQNNCDRVKIACIAQLVNAIAPIMTEKGGGVWLQTIFYPYLYASLHGRGTVMRCVLDCEHYATEKHKAVPYIEASAVLGDTGELTIFAINRSESEDISLDLCIEDFGECTLIGHTELYADDPKAVNSPDGEAVAPAEVEVRPGAPVVLKKHSWNMLKVKF